MNVMDSALRSYYVSLADKLPQVVEAKKKMEDAMHAYYQIRQGAADLVEEEMIKKADAELC